MVRTGAGKPFSGQNRLLRQSNLLNSTKRFSFVVTHNRGNTSPVHSSMFIHVHPCTSMYRTYIPVHTYGTYELYGVRYPTYMYVGQHVLRSWAETAVQYIHRCTYFPRFVTTGIYVQVCPQYVHTEWCRFLPLSAFVHVT